MSKNSLIAVTYCEQSQFDSMNSRRITFERMNSPFYAGEKWAVRCGPDCLNNKGKWQYEPSPSNRNDRFYKQCRFDSLQMAVDIYNKSLQETEGDER